MPYKDRVQEKEYKRNWYQRKKSGLPTRTKIKMREYLICLVCNKKFPSRIMIDGKKRGLYNRKYCLECSPYKGHNVKQLHIKYNGKYCQNCNNPLMRKQSKWCSRRCKSKKSLERKRKILRLKSLKYLGEKCQKCGYNKCLQALEFHHEKKEDKEFGISRWSTLQWSKIKKELDKCMLLCANCHREEHN